MARKQKNKYIFAPEKTPKKTSGCFIWVLVFIVLLVLVLSGISHLNNTQVTVETQKVTVWGLDRKLEGMGLLHISDLHAAQFGEGQQTLKAAIKNLNYKAVIITGDMVGKSGDYQPFLELLSVLNQNVPIYFIAGDSDPSPILSTAHGSASVYADYVQAAINMGAIYLDSPQALEVNGFTLWLCPEYQYSLNIENSRAGYQQQLSIINSGGQQNTADGAAAVRAVEYYLDALNRLEAAQKVMKQTDMQILVSHQPLTKSYLSNVTDWTDKNSVMAYQRVTLALSGHYTGGQWIIPLIDRALYVKGLGFFPDKQLYRGLSQVNNITQYISPGLGASDYYAYQPGRFMNNPVVTLITLTSKIS